MKAQKNPAASLWRGRLPGNFKLENDMKPKRQNQLYYRKSNHATPKHFNKQKAAKSLRPPTEFEGELNKTILEYTARNLLTEASFCCEECESYNSRLAPRGREHLQCARCGKLNTWKPVEISMDFGGMI